MKIYILWGRRLATFLSGILPSGLESADFFDVATLNTEIVEFDLTDAPKGITLEGNFGAGNRVLLSREMLDHFRDGTGPRITLSNWDGQKRPATGIVLCLMGVRSGEWKIRTDQTGFEAILGKSVWASCEIRAYNKSKVCIGDKVSMNGVGNMACRAFLDNSDLYIGRDCMFSEEILLQTTDSHTIFDVDTLEMINNFRSEIYIGQHVWLGRKASILPNVKIGSGSIIGFASIVTRSIAEKSLAVGSPAIERRSNVSWSRAFGHIDQDAKDFLTRRTAI